MPLELGLTGRTAVVTGASHGIGFEIARALAEEGVGVALVARTPTSLNAAARALRSTVPRAAKADVYPLEADLSLRAEVERVVAEAVARLGHVDILVNNAGRTATSGFFDMGEDELEETWRLKGLGYVRMVRALAPEMMERRYGRIVNVIGSTARMPTSDFVIGSMINAALVNFTRGISRELAQFDVRINAISPGWTLTDAQQTSFQMEAAARQLSVEEVMASAARALPLRRLVSMSEVAALALLLVSDLLPAMTGEDIVVDAGAGAARP